MEDLVVERVGPRRRVVLVHRHRRVVREVHVVEHLEHAVTAHLRPPEPSNQIWLFVPVLPFEATDREERSAQSADVFVADAGVGGHDVALAGRFLGPFLGAELFAEAVPALGTCRRAQAPRFQTRLSHHTSHGLSA